MSMLWLMLLLSWPAAASSSNARPGCEEKCGDVSVPYPFGIDEPKWHHVIRSQGDQQEHQNLTTSSRATFELRAHASHAWLHADRVPRAGCVCLCVEAIAGESPRQNIRCRFGGESNRGGHV
ncbi:hypothetical protein WN944_023768 [Citrus x changshan-huyou]|uniref:Secreted protein n=1 Tax=Citrus x changshan-huyou TaxID=2935761 RepID=A0AAP0QBY0_9ROSI